MVVFGSRVLGDRLDLGDDEVLHGGLHLVFTLDGCLALLWRVEVDATPVHAAGGWVVRCAHGWQGKDHPFL